MKQVDLKKMRIISVLWGFILLGIVIGLTIIGIVYKNESKEYQNFEKLISEKAKEYIELKGIEPEEKAFTITTNELLEEKLIETTEIKDNICSGYIEVTNKNGKDSYKPYVKCGKYKTRGYKNNSKSED